MLNPTLTHTLHALLTKEQVLSAGTLKGSKAGSCVPPAGVRGVLPFLNVTGPWRPTVHLAANRGFTRQQVDLCETRTHYSFVNPVS